MGDPSAAGWSGAFALEADEHSGEGIFTALSERTFVFNVLMPRVDPGSRRLGRVYVDPEGEALSGGLLKAPRLSYAEACGRYGFNYHAAGAELGSRAHRHVQDGS